MAPDPLVRLEAVSKVFPGGIVGLDAVDLDIARGEFLTLLGPSGCGKTTSLRVIAGFESPSSGKRAARRAATSRRSGRSIGRSTPSSRTTRCFRT